MDIYQEIWDEDQRHAGLKAVWPATQINDDLKNHGYVVVNESGSATKDHRVIQSVVIPDAKMRTYSLAKKLFNNYILDQTKPENNLPEETKEVQSFLDAIHDSPPMALARDYASKQTGTPISKDQWWAVIQRLWFERFDQGNNRDLSGFEHVVVGEQKGGKVQGYHSWYKYYLDEKFRRDDSDDVETDLINFISWKGPKDNSADVVTLSYQWRAFDYEKQEFRPLTKPFGGFWVGPSIEGLLALGTVRALPEVMAPKKTIINGVEYKLPLYLSQNSRHVRTFYPEFTAQP